MSEVADVDTTCDSVILQYVVGPFPKEAQKDDGEVKITLFV